MLDVDLVPVGTDRLAGTVTNRLSFPLKNAVIAFGKQIYYKVGTIEPGATVEVDATPDRSLGGYLQDDASPHSFMTRTDGHPNDRSTGPTSPAR